MPTHDSRSERSEALAQPSAASEPARIPRQSASAAHPHKDKCTLPGYENENIRFLNAQALSRPLDMTPPVRIGLGVFLVIALVISAFMLRAYYDEVINAPVRAAAALEESLSSEIPYDLPNLVSLMTLSDEDIMAALSATGHEFYEKTPIGTLPTGGFDVVKLPSTVSLDEATALYASGIDTLSDIDKVRLFNGSWDLEVAREDSTDLCVRFSDFKSASAELAVQSALEAEGLADLEITDSGIDSIGNTYATGTVTDAEHTYTWRVSAIKLSEIYTIRTLTSNAFYVGVRISA